MSDELIHKSDVLALLNGEWVYGEFDIPYCSNGYMIIDNQTYKVKFDIAEYILTNIFDCDTITLKENSIKGVFVDEI